MTMRSLFSWAIHGVGFRNVKFFAQNTLARQGKRKIFRQNRLRPELDNPLRSRKHLCPMNTRNRHGIFGSHGLKEARIMALMLIILKVINRKWLSDDF
jgi:hypothetical protein